MALVVKRKAGEEVQIGDDVTVKVTKIGDKHVKLQIDAPKNTPIIRKELLEKNRKEELKSANGFKLEDSEFKKIDLKEALNSNIGDVLLVKSSDVSNLGIHYFLITGENIKKHNGFRPAGVIYTTEEETILNKKWLDESFYST